MNLDIIPITVTRAAAGTYVLGRFVPGAAQVIDGQRGNIQPLTGKELQQLPEGDRQREAKKIYTAFALQNGDVVRAGGVDYEVQAVEDWTAFALPHFKARLVRIEEQ